MSLISLHLGHLGDLAGHDHWVAGGAIAAAGGAALWGWLKGKKEKDAKAEPEPAETPEEAPA